MRGLHSVEVRQKVAKSVVCGVRSCILWHHQDSRVAIYIFDPSL